MIIKFNFTYFVVVISFSWSQAQLYTMDMEALAWTHKQLTNTLDRFVVKEKKRLEILKRYLEIYKAEHNRAIIDIPKYLGNPLNAFGLIKRLTVDYDFIQRKVKEEEVYRRNKALKYPTHEDLIAAVRTIGHLQNFYRLNTTQLANGVLNGNFSRGSKMYTETGSVTPLTTGDCFELGRTLCEKGDIENGLAWSMEAFRKYRQDNVEPFTDEDIIEYISLAHYNMGDFKSALEWIKKNLLTLDPKDIRRERAQTAVKHYTEKVLEQRAEEFRKQNEIKHKETENKSNEKVNAEVKKDKLSMDNASETTSTDIVYESLCRGEINEPPRVVQRLKCRYLTESHPFLKLAAIKVEQLYFKPKIFLFHGVLSDFEIDHLKNLSKSRLQNEMIYDSENNDDPILQHVSKSTWLKYKESDVIKYTSRRIYHFTGLRVEKSAEFQVLNYGIGGFHNPHFDFNHIIPKESTSINRTATVTFYMSEVGAGGATVFPKLGLSVSPVKGAALFWINLLPSGKGDPATLHAECPVLKGSKWILNKWLHGRGQDTKRPCCIKHRKIPRLIQKKT